MLSDLIGVWLYTTFLYFEIFCNDIYFDVCYHSQYKSHEVRIGKIGSKNRSLIQIVSEIGQ